ncbi:MAG: efflux RND transporter periplasmic adaptor subunit [Gammaproteobacteria bacterium]
MKRRYRRIVLSAGLGLVALYSIYAFFEDPGPRAATAKVEEGPMSVWSVYNGKIDSRSAITVMSKLKGGATVIDLAAPGAKVSKGDVLVRLDSAELEERLLKLKKELAFAKSDYESLVHAKIPLDRRDKELKLLEARTEFKGEDRYLKDIIELASESLVSPQEVEQQREKVGEHRTRVESLELDLKLTEEYLHPLAIEKAKTSLTSAEQALALAIRQLEDSVIRAPSDGVIVYIPLHIAGKFRTIRIGDTVYANQPFMMMPDLSDLVVQIEVPESELSRVQKGAEAVVRLLAYPSLSLRGAVEHISTVALSVPERPTWQRFFHVVIGVNGADARIRPGMSATAHVLSYYKPMVTLVPRSTVAWEGDQALVTIDRRHRIEKKEIKVGMANSTHYEVIEGLAPGEAVLLQ